MNAVQITSLPTNGTLTKGYFGTININDILNYPSDFSSLIYYHSTGGITSAYDDYVGFRVRTNNNGSFSNEATLTFSVSACVAATTAYVPTTTVYVPTTTVYVPTTTVYVPTTTAYVPTTTAYVPTTTVAGTKPTVTTNTITSIGTTTATGGGNVTAQGSTAVTARGVCWKANATPFITDSTSSNGTGTGAFTSSLIGLTQNEAYYVRAYATNSAGTSYGAVEIFITESAAPVVSTSAASSVGTTTATANGSVTTLGNSGLQVKGFCWSTSTAYPTTGDTHSNNGNFASGAFSHDITGLAANTLYYVRAYGYGFDPSNAVVYGNTVQFTTLVTAVAPTVTTATLSSVGETTASGGGNVTAQGSASVTARGVCWSTISPPTIANSTSSNGTGTGAFTSSLIGLTQNQTYYVRAYATSSAGTSYGAIEMITTLNSVLSVTTVSIGTITSSNALINCNVTGLGNTGMDQRGVCWSTSNNYPSVSDSHSNTGAGFGDWTDYATSLTPNTLYYVRAYSHNDRGYFYGNTLSFTTSPTTTAYVPTTTTTAPEFSNYLVTSYDCNDCSIIDSNFLVTDYRSDLIFHRYYTDMLSGLTYRIIQTNASSGGISSNMTGSGVVTCAELNCI